jgi:hypothetical protein
MAVVSTRDPSRCPWCQATNLPAKLAARHGRCRTCGHDVAAGLKWLRDQRAAKTKAKTKAAKREIRKTERATPEYQQMRKAAQTSRAVLQAERAYTLAWSRIRLTVDEHDLAGVLAAARTLARANRRLNAAQRAFTQQQVQVTPPSRTVILVPDDDGSSRG